MADNILGTKITDLEEAQAAGLTDDALLIVEPETPPTKRSKLSTFFTWMKGKLAAWILTSYDEVMAATEAGYLVDALAVKDGFTQLNTNLGTAETTINALKSQIKNFKVLPGTEITILSNSYIGNSASYGYTIRFGGSSMNSFVQDTYWLSVDFSGRIGLGLQLNGAKAPTWYVASTAKLS